MVLIFCFEMIVNLPMIEITKILGFIKMGNFMAILGINVITFSRNIFHFSKI